MKFRDQDPWLPFASTYHTVYVTHGDPVSLLGPRLQETLFNIGCRNADGMQDNTNNAIVDAIYSEFTDQKVSRVLPSQGTLRPDDLLTYWKNWQTLEIGDVPDCASAQEILASDDGDGSCGAFASLLNHTLRAQGFAAMMARVDPVAPADVLQIKKWDYTIESFPGTLFPYKVGIGALPRPGMKGQGNDDPPDGFRTHIIVNVQNDLYDPSYGTPKISNNNGSADVKAYEESHVDGYGKYEGESEKKGRPNNLGGASPAEVTIRNIPSEG